MQPTLQGLWMSVRHEVLYVMATRIKFMCPMNYATFPMDRQTCKFQVRKDKLYVQDMQSYSRSKRLRHLAL